MPRMYLIVIVIAAVVLMIFFGRNPIEEAKKKRATALSDKIQEYSVKQRNSKSGRPGIPATNVLKPSYKPGTIGSQGTATKPPQSRPVPQGTAVNPNQRQMKGQGNGYYPPPPTSAPSNPLPQPMTVPGQPGASLYLENGQKLAFSGTKVFRVNAKGKKEALPDGNYPVFGGAVTMMVRGGQKVASN